MSSCDTLRHLGRIHLYGSAQPCVRELWLIRSLRVCRSGFRLRFFLAGRTAHLMDHRHKFFADGFYRSVLVYDWNATLAASSGEAWM